MIRKTKIVCTLGPATADSGQIGALIEAGMDVARINFSHGDRRTQQALIDALRSAADRVGATIPILADLQGPKIRIGAVNEGTVLQSGQEFVITTLDIQGNDRMAATSYKALPREIRPGSRIFIDDGLLSLEALAVDGEDVRCRVLEGGPLRSHKGMNLPDVALGVESLTPKDREDLAFALGAGVDIVALSFVRSARDVANLRAAMEETGISVPVIAKIERPEALREIDAIIAAADGIMVARGDLGVEVSSEEVPLLQKMMIRKALTASKPVITATQMLESMIHNSRPTRAESSDVANAVLDGTSAAMLSGETSVGRYPIEAVRTMQRIIMAVESRGLPGATATHDGDLRQQPLTEAVAHAACLMAKELSAQAIVTVTHSGYSAHVVASHRPQLPILAITDNPSVVRILNLEWGVRGHLVPEISDTDTTLDRIEKILKGANLLAAGDRVIYTAGMPLLLRGSTNMLKVSIVG